jgi:predicted dehydrogenase
MKEIKIGIIGVGLLGNFHNQTIQTIIEGQYLSKDVDVSVEAVCDTRKDHVKEYAKEWDIPHAFSDWRELLSFEEINTVYIATPTVSHKDVFIAAANAGKQIFIQKPLAFTIDDIQEMIATRNRNNIYVQVGHSNRNHPGIWTIRKICRDSGYRKKMGRLFNIHFRSDQEKSYTGSGIHPSTWRILI